MQGETGHKQEQWGSRLGVILAVMGSAIGLGNFLRFPGLAAKYGGGHFMVPYFIALLLLGLPIAWTEWSIGRMGGEKGYHSTPGIFRELLHRKWGSYIGVLGLIIPVGIYMYYVYIESWCLYYAISYLNGSILMGSDAGSYESFFLGFIGSHADGSLLQHGPSMGVLIMLGCFVLNFAIIYRGLANGIELVSKYAIPVLMLCAIGVLIRVLTLGTPNPDLPEQNVLNGLGYMWNPGISEYVNSEGVLVPAQSFWQALANPEMWMDATGQIFFSLSVGFGIIITYASYLRRKDDVLLSGTTSAAGNLFAEVALGGMITVPAAFIFLGPGTNFGSTFGLGFISLPYVFANMPLGQLVGFLWFALLFLAALTSSLSMLQPAIAFFEEGLGVSRRLSTAILAFITLTGSLFFVIFSKDSKALDYMDFWIGTVFIYILATILVIIFSWRIGVKAGMDHAHDGSHIRIPQIFHFVLKYVSPVYLVVVFAFWMYGTIGKKVQEFMDGGAPTYTGLFILLLLGFLTWLVWIANQRWDSAEKNKEA
ncbi:MAG: sodium:calcium symporter [Leptospiraceae bacterium]|nr:sodium:calcium symporter [Leptospiraceae bacterium]